MKSVALFDVDNTIYHGFSFAGLLENEVNAGILDGNILRKCESILSDYKNGKADYEASVLKVLQIHAAGLEGKNYNEISKFAVDFYNGTRNFYDFAIPTMKLLKTTHDVILVTAEPGYACDAIKDIVGASLGHSTIYEVIDGIFTGELSSTLSSRHDKYTAIVDTMHKYEKSGSFAFGDSEGDIEMLKAVDHSICINASNGLKKEAIANGWQLVEPNQVESLVKSILNS